MLDGEEIVQIACNKTCDMDAKRSAIGHSWERNVFGFSVLRCLQRLCLLSFPCFRFCLGREQRVECKNWACCCG